MGQAPCKDCERRHIGCHAQCDDYKAWREEQDRKVEANLMERASTPEFCGRQLKILWKDMKYKNRRIGR